MSPVPIECTTYFQGKHLLAKVGREGFASVFFFFEESRLGVWVNCDRRMTTLRHNEKTPKRETQGRGIWTLHRRHLYAVDKELVVV